MSKPASLISDDITSQDFLLHLIKLLGRKEMLLEQVLPNSDHSYQANHK
jgi:hypothetical protein